MKTFSMKPADVTRAWYVLDASELPLGRIASRAASLLLGKAKPTITAHVDGGDFVIIINSDNLKVTGNKLIDKKYYHHSGFPGGLSKATLAEKLAKDSTTVIIQAVRGMLPVNKLRDARLHRLKVYTGAEHNHAAQKPQFIDLKEAK